MKETIKTSRTAGYMEKIFRALNSRYFDSQLEEPVITIQSTPRAYGHVTVAKAWARADGERRHELNIGAGTLDRPIENVVATVLHEMVHLYHLQNGIKDCSRNGTYHNKTFRDAAQARDLEISYDKRIGWSVTEPSDLLVEFIIGKRHWNPRKVRGRHRRNAERRREAVQYTQAGLSQMRAVRPGYQGNLHHLRGLHGENGGDGIEL